MDATNKAVPDEFAGLREAVGRLIKAKGRFHTEQNYAALVAAYDASLAATPSQPAAVSAPSDEVLAVVERKEVHGSMCVFITRTPHNRDIPDGTQLVAARAAAPVSGQGASIGDDDEFWALLMERDEGAMDDAHATQLEDAIINHIHAWADSRPRSEDSREHYGWVLETGQFGVAIERGLNSPWKNAFPVYRALASTPPKADNE